MDTLGKPRGEIHLGELIRALAELPWRDASQARAIATSLGFGLAAPDLSHADRPTSSIYDRNQPSRVAKKAPTAAKPPTGLSLPTASAPVIEMPAQVLQSQLHALPPQSRGDSVTTPEWISGDYQSLDATPGTSPQRHPLFPNRTARGVFAAALSTLRPGRAIDIRTLLRWVVEGRIPTRLPRLPVATLSRGCQLLLDFSDSMLPWWEDLRELATQVAAVLGEERVAVLDFDAVPALARQWQRGDENESPWLPEAGRPILVATDLRIAGRQTDRRAGPEWRKFAADCAAHGCPLLILIPWSPSYWPTDLGPYPQLLHWHPRTSAAMLYRQVGCGQHSPQ